MSLVALLIRLRKESALIGVNLPNPTYWYEREPSTLYRRSSMDSGTKVSISLCYYKLDLGDLGEFTTSSVMSQEWITLPTIVVWDLIRKFLSKIIDNLFEFFFVDVKSKIYGYGEYFVRSSYYRIDRNYFFFN